MVDNNSASFNGQTSQKERKFLLEIMTLVILRDIWIGW